MAKQKKSERSENSLSYEHEMLRILLDVSRSLYQHINIDDMILNIIRLIKKLMSVEAVSVILHDEKKNEFLFRWAEDERRGAKSKLSEIRFPVDQGIAGSVFSKGKPELVLDIEKNPRHFKAVDTLTKSKTKSMIAVPLQKKEKIIGVLEVLNKKNGVFNKDDLNLISTIAPIMAMALDNARMYTELEGAYQDLQVKNKAKDSLIKNTREENIRLRMAVEKQYQFNHIIGNSDSMQDVYRLCEKVMDSDITILIEGETGTGKEVIARCIHYSSPRKEKPFVTQNCGGIPETLLTSELFGHKRGAFTGAFNDKQGLFEVADGGTIFLDEVAEMSPSMQTSILRVLQEGEIKPLGANNFKRLDVRVISATNQDLEDRVKKGVFREDLFYRLHVFPIKLPPLRERVSDIPILVRHFIKKFNQKYKRAVKGIDINAIKHLERYLFPGNVRELENEIERAVAMAEDGKLIKPIHLSDKIVMDSKSVLPAIHAQSGLKEMVETLEKSVLSQMLETHHANKTRVAKALGLSRYGLIKKIQRYGL